MSTITKKQMESLVSHQAQLEQAAVQLCLKLYQEEEVPLEQYAIFDQLGWSKRDIDAGVSKAGNMFRTWEQAGTDEQIAEAEAKLGDDRANGKLLIEELEEQIRNLQKQKSEISGSIKCQEIALETMQSARKRLRDLVPDHVRKRYDRAKAALKQSDIGINLLHTNTDVKQLKAYSAMDVDFVRVRRPEQLAAVVKEYGDDYPGMDARNKDGSFVNGEVIKKWQADMTAQIPDATRQLEVLQAEYDEQMKEVDSILDYWMDLLK